MVYHYTTVEVLFKLMDQVYIDKTNPDDWDLFVTLRASHASYLNDLSEGQLLPNVIKRLNVDSNHIYIADLLKGYPYIISFCKNKDSLCMWEKYGDNGLGVSIGFDEDTLHSIKNAHGTDLFSHNDCDCIYLNEDQLFKTIQVDPLWIEYSSNPQNLIPLEKLLQSSLKYKHEAFSSEEEYRLYAHEFAEEKFCIKGSRLIPYQDIRIPIESIKEIVLGPKTDKERLRFSIQRLLNKASHNILKYHRLENIIINNSIIPYI